MRLYYLSGSPFARVVRIVALELNAPCEVIEETEFRPSWSSHLIRPCRYPHLWMRTTLFSVQGSS